jgi:hypothetical protein
MQTTLLYTKPADIDGEPDTVRELSVQQLTSAVAQVSELCVQTIAQVRAAGLEQHETGDDWLGSEEGLLCEALTAELRRMVYLANRLQTCD